MIGVAAVNVGTPALLAAGGGERVYSGIAKRPVATGTVLWLSLVNLSGDGQADLSVHGGPHKAVYAYPSEHLPAWEDELGEPLGDAPFGEIGPHGRATGGAHVGPDVRFSRVRRGCGGRTTVPALGAVVHG